MNEEILKDLTDPWAKCYWYARMLISVDKYGGIGKDSNLLSEIAASIRLISESKLKEQEILELQKQTIKNMIFDRFKRSTKKQNQVSLFIEDVFAYLNSLKDVYVFVLTCENFMIPINDALSKIPNDDKKFTENICQSYLETQGESGLATVVKLWNDLGVKRSKG